MCVSQTCKHHMTTLNLFIYYVLPCGICFVCVISGSEDTCALVALADYECPMHPVKCMQLAAVHYQQPHAHSNTNELRSDTHSRTNTILTRIISTNLFRTCARHSHPRYLFADVWLGRILPSYNQFCVPSHSGSTKNSAAFSQCQHILDRTIKFNRFEIDHNFQH